MLTVALYLRGPAASNLQLNPDIRRQSSVMTISCKSKSASFPGQHEIVQQQTWPGNHYWAPFSMCNRNQILPNESSFKQTRGSQSHGGAAAGHDRQSQSSSALPSPSPPSAIGNTSIAATSPSRGLQHSGQLMNDLLR